MKKEIKKLVDSLKKEIEKIKNEDEKIDLLNEIRLSIHEVSPLKHHPVDCVLWIKSEQIEPNEYNPNKIFPPELALLKQSILSDGFTMSIVTHKEKEKPDEKIKIVDGHHRRMMEQIHPEISESTLGRVPLTFIRDSQGGLADRISSTVRHNRARGSHSIDLMSKIVGELVEAGMSDAWVKRHLGMDSDELLRLKQITGLASLFINTEFTEAWESDTKRPVAMTEYEVDEVEIEDNE